MHELLAPIIKYYQRWINELAALAIGEGNSKIAQKVERIERRMVVAMKPTVRKVAIFEAYSNFESKHAYTKTIGLVHKATDLPEEFDSKVKAIFKASKPVYDIYNEQKLRAAKD